MIKKEPLFKGVLFYIAIVKCIQNRETFVFDIIVKCIDSRVAFVVHLEICNGLNLFGNQNL
ncbi:MAG: hypothetical protein A2007_01405 [Verrucomicrobia bacterium GWC2_42_7]|nr:MAG: hypothetical protein A2007_01405 [Verrucomicrobia bacterium GWC2_42_7]